MKSVIAKLKFKDVGAIINAPNAIEKEFIKLGFSNSFDKKGRSKNTIVFVNNHKEFLAFLKTQLKNIEPDSVLWFSYPKGTSGIITDINRDILRNTALVFGLKTVTAVSIDDTWSCLRLRPIEFVGK